MNYKIAELLRDKIKDLPFVDRSAGLVRNTPIKVPNEDGMVTKNVPLYQNNETPCEYEDAMDLVPDSNKRGIVFFEDGGTDIISTDSRYIHCRSIITMVAWFNLPRINDSYTNGTLLMATLINAIPKYLDNTDFITRIMVSPSSFLPKDTVYSQYDLDLAENQYFAFPYDYFAFQFNITFSIPLACLDDVEISASCL